MEWVNSWIILVFVLFYTFQGACKLQIIKWLINLSFINCQLFNDCATCWQSGCSNLRSLPSVQIKSFKSHFIAILIWKGDRESSVKKYTHVEIIATGAFQRRRRWQRTRRRRQRRRSGIDFPDGRLFVRLKRRQVFVVQRLWNINGSK